MGEITPEALMGLIHVDRLTDFDRIIYEGAKRLIEAVEPSLITVGTSDDYHLQINGAFGIRKGFFSITGQQGAMIASILRRLPTDDLAELVDPDFRKTLDEIKATEELHVSIPTTWARARHGNSGLYDQAKQYRIEMPCVIVSADSEPDGLMDAIDRLVIANAGLQEYERKRRE